MKTNSNALTEVYFVLSNLNKDEYNKIPIKIIKAIKENMNIDYRFNIDEEINIMKQTFLPETRAILFNLFRDYLATDEQKNKIYKIQNREREELNCKRKNSDIK